jgi:hypothetical protein
MARNKTEADDFFEESSIDPLAAVTGADRSARSHPGDSAAAGQKQKAGFYLSRRVLARFNRKFYELKMEGKAIANKSALLEAALDFALDDIDRAAGSEILAVFDESPKA